jgi:hypothetical protein
MPTVTILVTGTLADIQAAQSAFVNAVTSASCTIQLPLGVLLATKVNSLSAISSQPLKVQVTIVAPNNADFQTLIANLQTVKTNAPNLTFATNYMEQTDV